jgi:hypothetical protein
MKFKLTSESPLLMHNGQLADPLNKYSKDLKRISGKRKKTDADHEEMSKIEWFASLYADKGKLCIPGEVLEAALVEGAKKQKLGKQFQTTVFVPGNAILHFDGDNLTVDELWERGTNRFTTGVRVQRSRVMRTRPRIDEWWCEAKVQFDDKILDPARVDEIMTITGQEIGIGDWRPKFGRFTTAKIK